MEEKENDVEVLDDSTENNVQELSTSANISVEETKETVQDSNSVADSENSVTTKVDETVVQNVSSPAVNKKGSKTWIIVLVIVLVVLFLLVGCCFLLLIFNKEKPKVVDTPSKVTESQYRLSGNGLEDFDLYFLQVENKKENKIYSPLSIKYALAMLQDGANGETKEQITNLIGDYKPKKYTNSDHMSFANAMFIRNNFKDSIKKEYTTKIQDKYNAEVIYDEFSSPDNINNWVSNKTFNLINNLVDKVDDNNFFLINALAIDMNWNNQIQCKFGRQIPCKNYNVSYKHENYSEYVREIHDSFEKISFNGKDVDVGMIGASINKYDIVKELGEDKIREEVGAELKEYINNGGEMCGISYDEWMNTYIKDLNSNYKQVDESTDFYLYNNDEVKVFAKDLKEYDGLTLQYVGIMPIKSDLDAYIKDLNSKKANEIVNNLKEIKLDSFKDGVVTRVKGSIPFFKYDYELKLKDDLETLGIKNAFDISKSDLSDMLVNEKQYISDALHKANIEFSNDGIKAAAATAIGGAGAAGCSVNFDHKYDVPIEEIDLTFNKPYMYIIRDKATGEVWFAGTVYNPETK